MPLVDMMNCEVCLNVLNSAIEPKEVCAIRGCKRWTHAGCALVAQKLGDTWYCKIHWDEISRLIHEGKSMTDIEEIMAISQEQRNDENLPDDSSILSGESVQSFLSAAHINESDKKSGDNNNNDKSVNLNPQNASRSEISLVPYDNNCDYNPFSNFLCEICSNDFSSQNSGALCNDCRSVFHLTCLNEIELESVSKSRFLCQDCIANRVRLENLKENQRLQMKKSNSHCKTKDTNPSEIKRPSHSVPCSTKFNETYDKKSSRKPKKKSKRNSKHSYSSDESSLSESSLSSNNSDISYRKKKKKSLSKHSSSSSSFYSSSECDTDVGNTKAISKLYKYATKDREKSKYEKLPLVEKTDMKWKVFYDIFKKSRKLFNDSENILRIQSSIKCKEILDIGGINLFDPLTYWKTLKLIDKRLCSSINLLARETNEIIKLRKMKSDCEPKKVIEFINKIINYSNIVDKHGKKKDKVDDRIISHITNVMPNYLLNGWHRKKAKLEANDKTVYLKYISKYLSDQVNYLNSKMHSENNDPWKESHADKSFNKKREFYDRNDRSFRRSYHNNVTNDKAKPNNSQFCWFHKSPNHSAFSCYSLWSMSGKEVSEQAKVNNICTFCGQKKHFSCPNRNKLICKMEGCTLNHHMLFCYKRKSRNVENNANRNKFPHDNKNKSMNKRNSDVKVKHVKNKSNSHRNNDDKSSSASDSEDSNKSKEIPIPPSEFYVNSAPKSLKVTPHISQARSKSIKHSDISSKMYKSKSVNINHSTKSSMKSSPCILGVLVIRFIDCNKTASFLLDSGSTVSLIEQNVADEMKMKGLWHPISLNWSSNICRADYGSRIIKANVSGTHPDASKHVIYFRTIKDLQMDDQTFDAPEMYDLYPHLNKMHLQSYEKIHGIIGMDNAWAFTQLKTFKPKDWKSNIPYGIRCPLGDYVIGNLYQLEDIYNFLHNQHLSCDKASKSSYNIHLNEDETYELNKMENQIMGFDYKQPADNDNMIYEHEAALNMLRKYVKRSPDGIHFEAPLLWLDETVKLPTQQSFQIALRRFMIVEKNSIKKGTHDECVMQVHNLLAKGYAEEVPPNEINCINDRTFYIPTFFIKPKNKRTRFIWDAATKVDGHSLNDYLAAGPNLYNDFLKIIFHMQEGRYLIKGDIQEMFHQVMMRDEDKDSLRFIFRASPNEKIKILRMRVMIFGSKSSPITSQYIKNEITKGYEDLCPDAVKTIRDLTYVDDVVTSVNDLESGKQLIYDARSILSTGGFNLVKLKSNEPEILDTIRSNLNTDDLSNEKLFSTESCEKLLGYVIDFEADTISIALTLEKIPDDILKCETRPTKKQILQVCMSIYDPVGYFEFLLSKFKLIYHFVIRDNYEWTQTLDEKYFPMWKKYMRLLNEVKDIKIPRWYSPQISAAKIIQLVGFSDASTEILCNVIYIRLLDENRNQLDHRFVCAKSYIVPLKQKRTIPDLELDAADKLVTLMNKVAKQHSIKFHELIYCIDSSAVKDWIINDAKNPKVYVKRRLMKIRSCTQAKQWKWVPTDYQPADFGTKITSIPLISYDNEWYHPKLFCLPEKNWPQIETNKESVHFHLANNQVNLIDDKVIEYENYSTLNRLYDFVRYCLKYKYLAHIKFIKKQITLLLESETTRTRKQAKKVDSKIGEHKKEIDGVLVEMNKKDLKHTQIELALIKMAQKESHPEEYSSLMKGLRLKKTNPLNKLLIYLDDDGIMRAKSRIADNPENRKKFGIDRISPIILPRNNHLTKLIILHYHNAQAHHNEKTVVVNLLQRFYIHKIKRTVNKVIRSYCMKCKIARAKPQTPLMGDLPSDRLAFHLPAFSYVIVDLLGPITVKILRNVSAKRYVLVYSCLTTRALHLELIESLEAHATLRALQNTFNLRGVPIRICSDNGTNFVGGHNIIQYYHDKWNVELLKKGAIIHPIEWDFSPPRAPHMNGSVERIVGLVKTAINHIQQYVDGRSGNYDDYGLKTILCEVINMLNSRPIEILSHDDNQHEYLTPNHFIMGRQNAQSVPPSTIEPKILTQQWEDIKMISNLIWENWMQAFLPTILMREKWIEHTKPLQVGDVVLTVDPSIANTWRKGIIVNVMPGSKDQVRKVVVKLGKNKLINNVGSRDQLLNEYRNESVTFVTRPAVAVAKINLNAQ
jgi:hypothetical protein